MAIFPSPPPGAVKYLFFHQLSGDAVETRCCHCITGGILEVIEIKFWPLACKLLYTTHIIIGILRAPLALRIVDPLSHDALCYALNILAHTILVSGLRVFLFLREGHVFLTLLHYSWLIHELAFCCWLAVWVQSHPCSRHTKQWQRSNHVYLSESECPVLHSLSLQWSQLSLSSERQLHSGPFKGTLWRLNWPLDSSALVLNWHVHAACGCWTLVLGQKSERCDIVRQHE